MPEGVMLPKSVHYEIIEGGIPVSSREPLWLLHNSVFLNETAESFWHEIDSQHRLVTVIARLGDKLIGYKMGYARKSGHFYSWLGCVDVNCRRLGIASELMRRQHDWCRFNNYNTIRTHTRNQWRDMLILNLRHGFDIIGTFLNDSGTVNIMLEKRLDNHVDSAG